MFTNDLPLYTNDVDVDIYAEDIITHSANKRVIVIKSNSQNGANGFISWCISNNMFINILKAVYMMLGSRQQLIRADQMTLYIENEIIQNADHQKQNLIKGIHDRVSAYGLLKVEKYIENLIDIDTNLCSPKINETQQLGTYRFDHVDEHNISVNCPSNITSSPELIAGHLPNNQPSPNVYENTTNHPTNLDTPWSNQPHPAQKSNYLLCP